METRYLHRLAKAYRKGYEAKHAGRQDAPEPKMHYFKAKEDLPRVQPVLGFLHGLVPTGRCNSLLDVGSGRGVFLFPLLRDFPDLDVTAIDILPHRVDLLECLRDGGIVNLHPMLANICDNHFTDKSFDVVTMLEVLEHIPDTESAIANIVRLARAHIIISVPSKPDDNPEHIHFFPPSRLEELLLSAGCSKVKLSGVNSHTIAIATL